MSLFDEIRLSFNLSRHNITDLNCTPTDKQSELNNTVTITVATQTDKLYQDICKEFKNKNDYEKLCSISTQTETKIDMCYNEDFKCSCDISFNTTNQRIDLPQNDLHSHKVKRQIQTHDKTTNTSRYLLEVFRDIEVMNFGTQTDSNDFERCGYNNNVHCVDCNKCSHCDSLNKYTRKLETELRHARATADEMQRDLDRYEDDLNMLQRLVSEGNDRNNFLKSVVNNLKVKLEVLEGACASHGDKIDELLCSTCSEGIQTESGNFVASKNVGFCRN